MRRLLGPFRPKGSLHVRLADGPLKDRLERLRRVNDKPWGVFLLGIVWKTVALFAIASVIFWILTRLRGY